MPTDHDRYESHVDRSDPDGCHLWLLRPGASGYGRIKIGGRCGQLWPAHRWGYEHGSGFDARGEPLGRPILAGFEICHTCDVPLCQNQRHWFVGTRGDNMRDCVAKGRHGGGGPAGGRHPNSKLTLAQAEAMRERFAAGAVTKTTLASEYGISRRQVQCIIERVSYV